MYIWLPLRVPFYAFATSLAQDGAIMAPLKVPLCYTYKTKGAFANPMRNQYVGGGGISETTWATEMVHLSKFAEFHEDFNGHIFNIATQLQIIIK